MGGHAEGLSSKVVPVKTPYSFCHQSFQIKEDDLLYVMQGQIKNVNFTMLISHLDKEGIWQARILCSDYDYHDAMNHNVSNGGMEM